MPLYNSQGQIFPIQAITEGGGQGGGHSGTPSGAGAPHGSVFFRKKKKKLAVNINYISWRKNVCFPHACLFISPGSTGSQGCGEPGLPLARRSCPCAPALRQAGRGQTVVSRLGTDRLPSVTNGFGCLRLVSCLALTHSACQKPLSPPFLSFLACFIGSRPLI